MAKNKTEIQTITEKDVGQIDVALMTRPTTLTQDELLALGEFDAGKALDTGKVEDAFMDFASFKEVARRSGLVLRKFAKLKPGESLVGVYLGPGPTIQMSPDRKTGEVVFLRTHAVKLKPHVIVDLQGNYQLDKEFGLTRIGDSVMIAFLGQVETRGGYRVNDYHFLRPGRSIEELIAEAQANQRAAIDVSSSDGPDAAPVAPEDAKTAPRA